jgi:DNA transformation protein and related proteins
MAVSSEYLAYIVDQLSHCTSVRSRRMFGGIGLYHEDLFFALIDDDQLYFKVNDSSREDYVSRGSHPFRPVGRDSKIVTLGYYTVPAEVLEDIDELKRWMLKAIDVARVAPMKKQPSDPARVRTSRKKQ